MESDRSNQAEKIDEMGSEVSSDEKHQGLAETNTDKVVTTNNGSGSTGSATAPSVFELQNLSVNFGRPILDKLTANVRGNCIGLLGPNGAGKTTLLNTLLGFNQPSSGRASIFGYDVSSQSDKVRPMVGYMPERDAFITGMAGIRFVRLMGELSGLSASDALERAHEVFFYVGLGEARYRKIDTYSLGMKQLVKLAQAIVHGPKLLFLDEPTNGLDPPARTRMLQLIREIRDAGDTKIIMASHLLKDVEECCDEALVLKQGKIAIYCNLEEERRSDRKFLLMQVRGDVDRFVSALRSLGCDVAFTNRRRLKVVLAQQLEIRDVYMAAEQFRIQIRNLDYKRDSLEDIFLRAMEDE